jgi:hypothetical protein
VPAFGSELGGWSMLSHDAVWRAIDALAGRHGLSASALARRAGLDATAFNRSKRVTGDGRLRWPSTESLSKVMDATGTSLFAFMELLEARDDLAADAPDNVRGFREDPIAPCTSGVLPMPGDAAGSATLIEVVNDAFAPFYRRGDQLIVTTMGAMVPGNRVLLTYTSGKISVAEVRHLGDPALFGALGSRETFVVNRRDLVSVARILWASQ